MNVLTIDIEDWFHILDNPSTKGEQEWAIYPSRIENNLSRILDILEKKNIKATFFCLGWIAQKYPKLIKKISDKGYEIGCHSHMHQLLYEQTPTEFEQDLQKAKKTIENITGKETNLYRAPGFSFTENTKWVIEILAANDFFIDSSVFSAKRGHGGIAETNINEPVILDYNGTKIKELPISYYNILGKKILFSGGGYFRLFPYPLIKRYTKRSDYVMTYFHPRDFDPDQPMIKDLPLSRKFKSYYGLKISFKKFNKWLNDFDFIDIKTAVNRTDWVKVKTIKI